MGISFLIKGLLIGLSIAAPLGPIGILCINRTLTQGPRMGFICGLGAATADAVYALAGAVALSAIAQWVIDDQLALRVIGGIFLVYLGARTFLRPGAVLPPASKLTTFLPTGSHSVFVATFLLTLANPMTLLGFAAIFAGVGVAPVGADAAPYAAAAALVVGVFVGSTLWWLLLSSLVGRLRPLIRPDTMTLINRISGTVLTAFGLYALAVLLPVIRL